MLEVHLQRASRRRKTALLLAYQNVADEEKSANLKIVKYLHFQFSKLQSINFYKADKFFIYLAKTRGHRN